MQYPISQTPAGLLAIAIATATVLLLGFATPAGAETVGGLQDAVDTVAEGTTSTVPASAPSPAEVEPEATNAPEAGSQATPETAPPAADVVDKVSEPIATATAEPIAAATSQASKLADDVGQRIADVQQSTAEAVEPVIESAGSAASAAADGEALVAHAIPSSQDSLKRAGENLAKTGTGLSSTSSALLAKAVLSASQAVSSVRSASDLVFSPASQELPHPNAADALIFASHPANGSPSPGPDRELPVLRGVDLLNSLSLRPLTGFGGIAPLRLWASPPGGAFFAGGDRAALETSAAAAPSSAASGGPANPNPPDGNNPLPPPLESPQAAASGLGGSPSFVPIVGLLALLALVVPTIFRRLREMAAFAVPTPFVCALERPG